MANFIKTKAGISIVAISVMVLIPMLELKFYAPVTIKRWSSLTWDDFQGYPRVFSWASASIRSSVYLEYDSARKMYHAYAGQDNIGSWSKYKSKDSHYLLNHEQYHFNITELHARILNKYIENNPNETEYVYFDELRSVARDLTWMQRRYDEETNHSLVSDKQSHWEFKIDSMLSLDSGWTTDIFSGATVYMPTDNYFHKGRFGQARYRTYRWSRYGMMFNMTSFQDESTDDSTIFQLIKTMRKGPYVIESVSVSNNQARTTAKNDSLQVSEHSLLLYNGVYLYTLQVQFPNNLKDTTGYYQIANSYFDSFKITDMDSAWVQRFIKSNSVVKIDPLLGSEHQPPIHSSRKEIKNCILTGKAEKIGFYRNPIVTHDGLLLPFDYVVDGDSLHERDILVANKKIYSYVPSDKGQIFFIPANHIPVSPYTIEFGYTLKSDSLKGCYVFHHHSVVIAAGVE